MSRNVRVLSALVGAILFAAVVHAQQPGTGVQAQSPPVEFSASAGASPEAAEAAEDSGTSEREITTGFLFADGAYVPLPYHIVAGEDGLTINGHRLPTPAAGIGGGRGRPFQGEFRPGVGWGGGGPPGRQGLSAVSGGGVLDAGGILILRDGDEPVRILGDDRAYPVLKVLTDKHAGDQMLRAALASIGAGDDDEWKAWIDGFEATAELRDRAAVVIEPYDRSATANVEAVEAVRRLDAWSYPLIVFGMLLGAITLGHLLMSLPREAEIEDPAARKLQSRATLLSLGLVLALSALDLTWTILASQAGQMKELNPLGSMLIDDPESLILFKTVATCFGVALLLALRKHRTARLASWWMCLLLMVLNFRWVMFNSMFIS